MVSPKEFSKKTGLSYGAVLMMCKKNEINAVKTQGGQFKIFDKELKKYTNDCSEYVSREEYTKVVRENERLRTFIDGLKIYIANSGKVLKNYAEDTETAEIRKVV